MERADFLKSNSGLFFEVAGIASITNVYRLIALKLAPFGTDPMDLFESLSWWACVDHDDNDLTPMILEENVADHYYEPLDEAF